MAMGKLKATIRRWRERREYRRRHKQEREEAARQNTRDYYASSKDLYGGGPEYRLRAAGRRMTVPRRRSQEA
jgi:hypothetical protein